MAGWDWAATPLGESRNWPSSLRSVVRILLTSRFPMWMGWGRDLSFFYNDAYWRDTLRAKHPWALGRAACEVWAEIWEDIGPRLESVVDSGVATWDEDLLLFLERSGYPEETYHTFSYSPLVGEGADVAGILCVVTEGTDRVLSERRMATLQELGSALAASHTEDEVFAAVRGQVGRNGRDLPFTLTYLFEGDRVARLACSTGIEMGHPAAPAVIELGEPERVWPVGELLASNTVIVADLATRFELLPVGDWEQPPTHAVGVPIAQQGQHRPAGFLITALNPFRRLDDRYQGFVDLLAGQIASALASAGAYEAEHQRAAALAELDRAKTEFFSNVSHELRTPLTLIMGPLTELRGTLAPGSDDGMLQELEVIYRNGLRLGKLVNTLLDFSRIQAGRTQASYEPVDLGAFTAELASVFRSAIERAGLHFVMECSELGEPVYVDREMWEKVVLNLLSNAVKFTFQGQITVAVCRRDGFAVVTVADTGTGVPADELPRLFDRFHRVHGARARSNEGSGIGLALVAELVGLHGGAITVDSALGVGSTFTVTLPLGSAHLPADQIVPAAAVAGVAVAGVTEAAQPFVEEALRWLPDTPAAPEAPLGLASAVAGRRGQGRVLVADDNADMREYLTRLLATRFQVRAVADGLATLDAALADPPDLIVSDVMMPGLDGLRLVAALRADQRTARVPVVLLSARAGQEAAIEGLAAGADDYLVKPFSARELLARAEAHLRLGRTRREAEERFRVIADLAPALIWVADLEGRRVFCNRGWQEFTGGEPAAQLGVGWQAAVHPEDLPGYQAVAGYGLVERGPWQIEYRLRQAQGAYHWVLEHAVPIGEGDSFVGYVGSAVDINTRYRETERQTLLSELAAAMDEETSVARRMDRLTRLLVQRRIADQCTIIRGDPSRGLHHAAIAAIDDDAATALAAVPPDTHTARQVCETRQPLLIAEVTGEFGADSEKTGPHPEQLTLHRQLRWRSVIAAPLLARGQLLGLLMAARHADSARYDPDDLALLEEIAQRGAAAVDNALLLAAERAARMAAERFNHMVGALSGATGVNDVAAIILDYATDLGALAAIVIWRGSQERLTVLAARGYPDPAAHLPIDAAHPVSRAVRAAQPVWQHRGVHPDGPFPVQIAVPLIVDNTAIGALGLRFAGPPPEFAPEERAMILALAGQCGQALDRARLYQAEHDIAETLQRSLLPRKLPEFDRVALAACYLPGAQLVAAGGDWYDVLAVGPDRVAIVAGDVVGKGAAAAAVMGQLRTALATALLHGDSPATALEHLDRLAASIPGARTSTAAVAILDLDTGELRWARAGHPPPLVLSGGAARYLTGALGTPLGIPRRTLLTEDTTRLNPGDSLLLYTDGLIERRGQVIDHGLERLAATAAGRQASPPHNLVNQVLADTLPGTGPEDDIALIAARYLPGPLHQRLAADPTVLPGLRRTVRAWAQASALGADLSDDLHIALGEAAANAIEHAYAGRRQPGEFSYLLTRRGGGTVEVEVHDYGCWRPPPADNGNRGRGLIIIHKIADDVVIDSTLTGTQVRFQLPALPPEPGPVSGTPASARPVQPRPLVPPVPAEMQVNLESDGERRLVLRGELDLPAADNLRKPLLDQLSAPGEVILDLTELDYLCSAGVGLLIDAAQHAVAHQTPLRIHIRAGSVPARVLELTGLEPTLPLTTEHPFS